MAGDGSSVRIVLFPFPAEGHFSAFLSLAALLHRANPTADIVLVSTPRNVENLRRSTTTTSSPSYLRFHVLPFVPADHGLPADVESADALPIHHFMTLFDATESPSLQHSFDAFVGGCTSTTDGVVVVVVADPLLAWTTAVARRHGAAHAVFVSCGAFGSAVYHSLWNHLPHLRRSSGSAGDDGAFCLPDHPEVTIHRSQLPAHLLDADGTDCTTAYHHRLISAAYDTDAVLINTTEELEPAGLRMARKTMADVPIYPIGPLVRRCRTQRSSDEVNKWLDGQAERSVLYISFGSHNSLRLDQMVNLATALELTGRPFIWAIRSPMESDTTTTTTTTTNGAAEWLPEGFEERVSGNNTGLLIHGWAPQVSILAHVSTGAFLTHCGWNSVLESVAHGVPMVAWPLAAEQFFNAKMMEEEWGACVEVSRGNAPCSPAVEPARVAEAVEKVMGRTAEAREIRRRVKRIQELIGRAQLEDGGSSVTALQKFFSFTLYDRTVAKKC